MSSSRLSRGYARRNAESLQTACTHGGYFGVGTVGGTQAEAVRIPLADGTLYKLPIREDDALIPSLLTLSDVMGTGHHAAVTAHVTRGKKVAVIGDGAVGLCGVIAAKRLGAEQIIILGRHPTRIALARRSPRRSGLRLELQTLRARHIRLCCFQHQRQSKCPDVW
jgi:threonine dehydrogenase-like Zn-dependent dehydrogenase